ncbi:MAG: AAA family ATPase [Caldilineaceae bacterium]|nr:AAA family ATPase [Caldilineaceae bacterium]
MLPKIEIRAFGTLQVTRDQEAVTESDWHTRQARQLLKILITERPRPVSTDRLIETLWPASAPNAAATTLRSAINALRNVLEPDRPNRAPSRYIITRTPGYAFYLHEDIWLDVHEFERILDRAAKVPERQLLLEEAVALYQDDYLISDPYADWAQNERDRLRERYFNALLELSELQAAQGHYAAAISACRRILARDEVRENAYQSLMRFQAESGDSASALLTYERCRTILAEELGADPSPLTQMLHQRILNGEIAPAPSAPGALSHALPRPAAPDASAFVLPHSALLPSVNRPFGDIFVGREAESAELSDRLGHLNEGRGELVILAGEAGVGKTRLAYNLLHQAAGEGVTVISGSCQQIERKLPFAPLADAIGRYLHSLPEEALFGLPPASLAQIAQVIPSLQDILPELTPLQNDQLISPDEHRQRLIEGIVAFLDELARLRPLLLFIDDLHWADQDSLAVISRLAQRLQAAPILLLLAYRSDDLPENDALISLIYTLKRIEQTDFVEVARLSRAAVREFVSRFMGGVQIDAAALTDSLYEATQGNPLFVAETLRDLEERYQSCAPEADEDASRRRFSRRQMPALPQNQRVDEIVQERVSRLDENAREILQLCAVIGRDFSLDMLEHAAVADPVNGLEILLRRNFLIERPDERLDFSHQIVRQSVSDRLNALQRRRLHHAIGEALVQTGQADRNPSEAAFHFGLAGVQDQMRFHYYSVMAGEALLKTFGFYQAIEHFTQALGAMDVHPAVNGDRQAEEGLIGRALIGLGLAYESLLDAEGVTTTYRRLHTWAHEQEDIPLMLTAHSRLAATLELMGQQRESNALLRDLMASLLQHGAMPRSVIVTDLLERRRGIYSPYEERASRSWAPLVPPPPVPADPVQDILRLLDPVHAVQLLLSYGWTLRVQGQLGAAAACLERSLALAKETGQRSLASIAYFQLAVIARMRGDVEKSQELNEASIALNRLGDSTGELVSLWPRIASAFQSLHAGRIDEAEGRLRRVVLFLDANEAFRNHRNSANIGLGLVALARGEHDTAREMLQASLADAINLYPYTHVQALIGLADLAAREDRPTDSSRLLRQALRFAGQRSLIEEYVEVVLEIARLQPIHAPVRLLLQKTLEQTQIAGMIQLQRQLRDALEMVDAKVSVK